MQILQAMLAGMLVLLGTLGSTLPAFAVTSGSRYI